MINQNEYNQPLNALTVYKFTVCEKLIIIKYIRL